MPQKHLLVKQIFTAVMSKTQFTSKEQLTISKLSSLPVMQEDVSRHTLISCEHAGGACVTHDGMCAQGVTRVTGHRLGTGDALCNASSSGKKGILEQCWRADNICMLGPILK